MGLFPTLMRSVYICIHNNMSVGTVVHILYIHIFYKISFCTIDCRPEFTCEYYILYIHFETVPEEYALNLYIHTICIHPRVCVCYECFEMCDKRCIILW